MDELQAGVEEALAVFPESPVFLQPSETTSDDPALGHDLEGVQLTALGNLYCDRLPRNVSYAFCERRSRIAAVTRQTSRPLQVRLAASSAWSAPLWPVASAVVTAVAAAGEGAVGILSCGSSRLVETPTKVMMMALDKELKT